MWDEETPLSGGNLSAPVRVGNTVRRATGPWSPAVHDLLRYLERQGFRGAPRVLGFDERGREVLTYIDGEVGNYPLPAYMWSDETLAASARFLRTYHDATATYRPPQGAHWQFVYPDSRRHEVLCHNDFAPYNLVFVDRKPEALIDFDWAGPGPRIWDIAYAAYRFVPLSDAADMQALGLTGPEEQARRLALFCSAYGFDPSDELLDTVERRLRALCSTLSHLAARGNAAYQKMVDEGHLDHYQRELAAFRVHRPALEAAL